MASQMIIGRKGNQPFAIPDPQVSGMHAFLHRKPDGQYYIIDNNSVNGTFIYNGQTFVRLNPKEEYPVTPETMIQLGPQTRFHIRKLLTGIAQPNPPQQQQPKPKPQPKKVDISHLRMVSENYDEQKIKLESKNGMVNGLRSCTVLITLLASGVSAVLTTKEGDTDDKIMSTAIYIGIALVLMVVLLLLINNFNKKIIRKRKENEQNYAVKYVCPECHVSFRGKVYENILAERSCPKCKTLYYDKNQQN